MFVLDIYHPLLNNLKTDYNLKVLSTLLNVLFCLCNEIKKIYKWRQIQLKPLIRPPLIRFKSLTISRTFPSFYDSKLKKSLPCMYRRSTCPVPTCCRGDVACLWSHGSFDHARHEASSADASSVKITHLKA